MSKCANKQTQSNWNIIKNITSYSANSPGIDIKLAKAFSMHPEDQVKNWKISLARIKEWFTSNITLKNVQKSFKKYENEKHIYYLNCRLSKGDGKHIRQLKTKIQQMV